MTFEAAEEAIKKHEDVTTTMDANDERINSVVETGRRLVAEENICAEKIQEKIDDIEERFVFLHTSLSVFCASCRKN